MDEELLEQLDVMVRAAYVSRDEIVETMTELAGDEGIDIDGVELAQAIDAALADLRAAARKLACRDRQRPVGSGVRTPGRRWDRGPSGLRVLLELRSRRDLGRGPRPRGVARVCLVPSPGHGARRRWATACTSATARATRPSGLRRLLGARGGGDARGGPVAIGREIAQALIAADLPVTWNGKTETRILVDPFEWRRRPPD